MGRLLVSVRGPNEALEAAKGGAHIADVEYPGSALGTPYPLNIKAVRDRLDDNGFENIPISTNIGEKQPVLGTACQSALGVAVAGADYVKCGMAGLDMEGAAYIGRSLVRTVREWQPERKIYPAVFPEKKFADKFNPLLDGPALVEKIQCDGLLLDTFDKGIGISLLGYYTVDQINQFVNDLHSIGKEAWIAGSLTKDQLPLLWATDVDVICVRGAACSSSNGEERFGSVEKYIVAELVNTKE